MKPITQEVEFIPAGNRALIREIDVSETSEGGMIFIPEISREKPQEGEVVAIGPGSYQDGVFIPTSIKAGDRVLVSKFAGTQIRLDGQDFLIVREEEILGTVIRTKREPIPDGKGLRLITEGLYPDKAEEELVGAEEIS